MQNSNRFNLRSIQNILLMTVILVMAFSNLAMAQATQEEATRLKKMFTEYLEFQKANTDGPNGKLVTKGELMVEPNGNYYAITFPHLSYQMTDGSYTDIGIIAMNALKGDKENLWKTTVAVPTPIVFYDKNKKPSVKISLGKQSFAGVWHEELKNFMNVRAKYKNFEVSNEQQAIVKIPEISVISDLRDNSGLWSGPYDYTLSGLQVFDKGRELAKVDAISIVGTIDEFDPKVTGEYQDQVTAMLESYDEDGVAPSGEQAIGFYNFFANYMSTMMDGFDGRFIVSGINVSPPAEPGEDPFTFSLDEGSYLIGMDGLKGNDMSIDIGFGYNGLDFSPQDPQLTASLPTRFNYLMSIEKLPIKELLDLGRSSLTGYMQQPEMGQMLGMQALFSVPQLLTQAGTRMTLKDTHLGNDNYNMSAEMNMVADLNAAKGAVGKGRVEVFGLEKMIELTNNALNDPEIGYERQSELNNMVAGLTAMQMFGQMGQDDQGRDIRFYNLELTKEGQMLLNGSDVNALMGAQ